MNLLLLVKFHVVINFVNLFVKFCVMCAMESNRDDAERCIELATKYLQDGNREKAEKLLMKSERLFPTAKAKGTVILG